MNSLYSDTGGDWISEIDERCLYICVLTIGEIHKGIEKLPIHKHKQKKTT